MGFEKLIDLIVQFLEFFRFCIIVDCYELGVRLRRGKFHAVLDPGIHLLCPGYIDSALTESSVTQIYQCATQSLITSDDKAIAAGIVITYHVHDIRKALLEVHDVKSAIYDACLGTTTDLVMHATWDEVRKPEFLEQLTKACRKLGFRYGLEVEKIQFNELAPLRTYRLITGT